LYFITLDEGPEEERGIPTSAQTQVTAALVV
jgi:hypothetical protein